VSQRITIELNLANLIFVSKFLFFRIIIEINALQMFFNLSRLSSIL